MTAILARLLGRMPIGWLQLLHNKTRLAAAVAGIAFANILVFVQLGIMFALNTTVLLPYTLLDADIIMSSADSNTLIGGGNVPRQRSFEALSVPGVASAVSLFIGNVDWTRDDGNTTNLQVLAIDPSQGAFVVPEIRNKIANLLLVDTVLFDRRTRGADTQRLSEISPDNPLKFEARGRTLTASGTISIGGGFSSDGYLVTSDQTFLRLFNSRIGGAPNHILLKTDPGADVDAIVEKLRVLLPEEKLKVRRVLDAAKADQRYQTTERPTGLVFGFGVVMGVIVGLVIVYQLLSTDVADHLKEYATFKAMGYGQSFFMGIIFEEAMILAIFGFVPGFIIASILYQILNSVTGLPVLMDVARPVAVFLGTIASCSISGAIATRRLASADPAELF